MKPSVQTFFDEATFTASYLVWDSATRKAAIIDSVLDFDRDSGSTSRRSANQIVDFVRLNSLDVEWILETHAHADHLSAALYLHDQLGGKIGIGAGIVHVQRVFSDLFNFETEFVADGSQFDHLFEDGAAVLLGDLSIRVMQTPGHTPACVTYLIGDAAFVGDTLFMPDFGTARTDFPGGDPAILYKSIQQILSLPDDTRIFTGHDYKADGRDDFVWESTVAEQKARNIHVHTGVSLESFVEMRTSRDEKLAVPRLILPSIQVNVRAGAMPPAEDNGTRYLKLPIDVL